MRTLQKQQKKFGLATIDSNTHHDVCANVTGCVAVVNSCRAFAM